MTVPASTPFADEVYEKLEPVARGDDQRGYPLLVFMVCLSQLWGKPEEVLRSTGGYPAGSQALDIDRCPAWLLPWLGQFVGVRVRTGLTEPESRAQVADEQGFRRGRTSTLVAAIQATLDPASSRYVFVEERLGGDAARIRVTVRPSQVLDASATAAAAEAAKLGGLLLTLLVVASMTYGEWETAWAGQTYANVESAFATYADAEAL